MIISDGSKKGTGTRKNNKKNVTTMTVHIIILKYDFYLYVILFYCIIYI